MKINKPVTDNEVVLREGQTLVSKTTVKGVITYVNKDFVETSGFSAQELLHKSHNVVRHPDMPQAAFQDLWDTVREGRPWHGLVKNRCKNGDYYWVDANVAPVLVNGEVTEYLSVRTKPSRQQIQQAEALYSDMRANKAQPGRLRDFGPLQLWSKSSLKARMNSFLAVLALTIALTGGLGLQGIGDSSAEMLRQGTLITQSVDTARSAQVHFKKQVQEWKNILLRGNDPELFDKYLAKFSKEEDEVRNELSNLRGLLQQKQVDTAAVDQLLSEHATLGEKYRSGLASYDQKNPQSSQIVDRLVSGIDRPATKAMDALVDKILRQAETNLEGLSKSATRSLSNIFTYGAIAAMLLLVTLALWLGRGVLKPLRTTLDTFREIGEGEYNGHIDTSREDEIGELLRALKSMQINLAFTVDEVHNTANAALRIKQALDNVSADVVVADAEHNIIYVNKAAESMFLNAQAQMRQDLPGFDARQLLGTKIDAIHLDPAQQRNMLANLAGVHESEFKLGGHTFRFVANPIIDAADERIGTVVEWADRSVECAVEDEVQNIVASAQAGDLSRRIPLQNKQGFFSTLSVGINDLVDVSERVINDTMRVLGAMARGELSETIEADYDGAFGQLKHDANTTVAKLNEVISKVQTGSGQINSGAEEVSQGNTNLSQRTEEQAATLEETASGMEEMNATVKQNADNAAQANQLAASARAQAEQGGTVVSQAVAAMGEINQSSKKIAAIIGVIDEIAFQTNLLALNAAVEAARAGDQGRGFAVVASEVRNLAQRSAGAAKEIKSLIEDSVDKVVDGSRLVDESGRTLAEIVTSVKKVSNIIAEIAAAGQEQAMGIDQVNKAVMQLDEMTQQNAALVEQAAAASESMSDQASDMHTLMGFFQLGESATPMLSMANHSVERRSAQRPWNAEPPGLKPVSNTRKTSKLDFASARSKHLSWKTRIRGFLDGKESLSEAQAVSHRDCDLGKWLYSTGMDSYGHIHEMQKLEKTHAIMHGVIKDIVGLKNSGQDDTAESHFAAISAMSETIVSLLTQVEGKVKAAGAVAGATGTHSGTAVVSDQEWDEF